MRPEWKIRVKGRIGSRTDYVIDLDVFTGARPASSRVALIAQVPTNRGRRSGQDRQDFAIEQFWLAIEQLHACRRAIPVERHDEI